MTKDINKEEGGGEREGRRSRGPGQIIANARDKKKNGPKITGGKCDRVQHYEVKPKSLIKRGGRGKRRNILGRERGKTGSNRGYLRARASNTLIPLN